MNMVLITDAGVTLILKRLKKIGEGAIEHSRVSLRNHGDSPSRSRLTGPCPRHEGRQGEQRHSSTHS
jgi:hypothetical protein